MEWFGGLFAVYIATFVGMMGGGMGLSPEERATGKAHKAAWE